jgi:hypothetical protein
LPKIGLGTHFSDLSNIFPNGCEVELAAVGFGAVADSFEPVLLVGMLLDPSCGVLIFRFWNALLMPPLPLAGAVDAMRAEDADGEEDDECWQLCWLGAR